MFQGFGARSGPEAVPSAWLDRVRTIWVSPADIRSETWALSARHAGRVSDGARHELSQQPLSFRRALLLKGVLRDQGLRRAGR